MPARWGPSSPYHAQPLTSWASYYTQRQPDISWSWDTTWNSTSVAVSITVVISQVGSDFLSFWHLILYSGQYHMKYVSTSKVNTCLVMFRSLFISEKICIDTDLFPVIYGKTVESQCCYPCCTMPAWIFQPPCYTKSESQHVIECSTWQNISYNKEVLILLVLQKGNTWIYWLYELTKWRI